MNQELCTPDELCERIEHVGRRSLAVTVEALQRDMRFAIQYRDNEIARCSERVQVLGDELRVALAERAEALRKLSLVATELEDVWRWEVDGDNHPASLSCPVIMSADTLRDLLGERGKKLTEILVPVVYEPDPRITGVVKIGMPGSTRRSQYYTGEAESAAICVALEDVMDRVARDELPADDDFTVRVVFVDEFGARREHGGSDPVDLESAYELSRDERGMNDPDGIDFVKR